MFFFQFSFDVSFPDAAASRSKGSSSVGISIACPMFPTGGASVFVRLGGIGCGGVVFSFRCRCLCEG